MENVIWTYRHLILASYQPRVELSCDPAWNLLLLLLLLMIYDDDDDGFDICELQM